MVSVPGKSAVILGSASTVARSIALRFAKEGYTLVLADFDHRENERIAADIRVRYDVSCYAIAFDATSYDTHEKLIEDCETTLGEVPEGVILCFGYMQDQEVVQKDFVKARRTIDTNFTGAVSLLERYAAIFEERGSGWIAGISSVAGDRGRQSNYIYGASKAGLSAYLQGLRNRLWHKGVHVMTIKPGFMDTKMTYGLNLPKPLVATPDQAAEDIYRALQKRKNVVHVRFFWRYIMLIICSIPEWQFKKMKM
jgi:short-subunit dehydrogenase